MRPRTYNLCFPALLVIGIAVLLVACEQATKTSSHSASASGATGGGGLPSSWLWKPVSEKTKNAVVLLSRGARAGTVGVYYNARAAYDSARLDGDHGGRQVWRLPKPGDFYEPQLTLVVDKESFIIRKPAQRQGQ